MMDWENWPPKTSMALAQPPVPLPVAAVLPQGMAYLSADDALKRLATMYGNLQRTAARIIAAFKGSRVPCDVIDNYNRAVKIYLTIGAGVFDRLARDGFTPVQFPMDISGNPVVDRQGNPKQIALQAPLRPTVFVVPAECPTAMRLSAPQALGRTLQGLDAPAVLVACLTSPVAGLGCLGLLAGATLIALAAAKAISLLWPSAEEKAQQQHQAWLDTVMDCIEQQRAAGVSPDKAAIVCQTSLGPAPGGPSPGWSPLAWVGLASIVLGVGIIGGYVLFTRTSPAARVHRRRIEEAEAEAAAAAIAARTARRRARAVRRGEALEPEAEAATAGFGDHDDYDLGCPCL